MKIRLNGLLTGANLLKENGCTPDTWLDVVDKAGSDLERSYKSFLPSGKYIWVRDIDIKEVSE